MKLPFLGIVFSRRFTIYLTYKINQLFVIHYILCILTFRGKKEMPGQSLDPPGSSASVYHTQGIHVIRLSFYSFIELIYSRDRCLSCMYYQSVHPLYRASQLVSQSVNALIISLLLHVVRVKEAIDSEMGQGYLSRKNQSWGLIPSAWSRYYYVISGQGMLLSINHS